MDAIYQSITDRGLAACRQAGVADAGHLHNAMCALASGRPWREVNYDLAAKAQAIFAAQHKAHRWLSELYRKRGPNAFVWDDPTPECAEDAQ